VVSSDGWDDCLLPMLKRFCWSHELGPPSDTMSRAFSTGLLRERTELGPASDIVSRAFSTVQGCHGKGQISKQELDPPFETMSRAFSTRLSRERTELGPPSGTMSRAISAGLSRDRTNKQTRVRSSIGHYVTSFLYRVVTG
jgi:hypothetical protein